MEEKNLTPEEAFYTEKANLERELTNRIKHFAGTFATNVEFACKVEVEFMNSTEGGVVDYRISGVELKTNYSQNG